MPEIIRSRDCIVFFKGNSTTVVVSQDMVNGGWPGGQGVQWVDSTVDERLVTYSSGLFGGFLIWGSDESGDQHTAQTRNQLTYRFATMLFGGDLIATTTFEKYTYLSRVGGGPLVALVYQPNDILYFSLRGWWTKEDELTLSGDPRAPAFFCGFVAQVPRASNNQFMGIQTSL